MDLTSGYPFWPIQSGLIASYPALDQDVVCDVAVLGGGVTGALCAYYLAQEELDTVVIDRRDVAQGSTAATTGLLQYEVDEHLADLIDTVGQERAVRSYLLGVEAIAKLEKMVRELDFDCGFERKRSLYLASRKKDVAALRREYEARRACGIRLDYLDADQIAERFSFRFPAALFSYDAAQIDAYRFTHALLRSAIERGLRVFDRTAVTQIEAAADRLTLTTDRGTSIRAKSLVQASGYEAQQYLQRRLVEFHSTYALISEPRGPVPGWGEDHCLLWESARPYFYLRTTKDGRVLVGGADDRFDNEARRDRRLPRKTQKLKQHFEALFPGETLDVAYSWAGTFGSTKDGLAYIGKTDQWPNTYFALGYGGNGITYSLIAAEIIRDAILGRPNPDSQVFSFER